MSTHSIQFHDKIRKFPNYLFSWAIGRILWGLQTEFESAMVNEPSVFELLKFDCSSNSVLIFREVTTVWNFIVPLPKLTNDVCDSFCFYSSWYFLTQLPNHTTLYSNCLLFYPKQMIWILFSRKRELVFLLRFLLIKLSEWYVILFSAKKKYASGNNLKKERRKKESTREEKLFKTKFEH